MKSVTRRRTLERLETCDPVLAYRVQKRSFASRSQRIENYRHVEHNSVNTRELLEAGDGHSDDQHWAVSSGKHHPPRLTQSNRVGHDSGFFDIFQFSFNIGSSTQTLQYFASTVSVATFDQRIGRLRQENASHGQDRSRHSGQPKGQSPSLIPAIHTVVNQLCDQDTNGSGQLEKLVQSPPELEGGRFGQV